MSGKAALKKQEQTKNRTLNLTAGTLKYGILTLTLVFLLLTAYAIFKDEFAKFFSWYLVVFACGIATMPVTLILLGEFRDSGWIFSKAIGIAFTGWWVWFLTSLPSAISLNFSVGTCWGGLIFIALANGVLYVLYIRKNKNKYRLFRKPDDTVTSMFIMEILFLLFFIFWTYLKAFKPEAYGTTEKLMDIGFMQAMFKSDSMPPVDMWLSGQPLNYYYVGQFLATYLTKLSGVGIEYGYNFMLMLIAALSFTLPCSLAANAAEAFTVKQEEAGRYKKRLAVFPYLAGGLAGAAVSFAGTFQYTLYARVLPVVRNMLGIDKLAEESGVSLYKYWFPDATRFIGYFPETKDKTIHEFPLYSFVLGDLHAHVLNIIFVLCVVAILLGFMLRKRDVFEKIRMQAAGINTAEDSEQNTEKKEKNGKKKTFWGFEMSELFDPAVIAVGFFIGLFHTTNFWDYPIYFVVSGAIILFVNCLIYRFSMKTIKLTLCHAVIVLVISYVVCLPFTVSFNQISTGIRLAENHTPLYQLLIIWGIPVITVLVYLFEQLGQQKAEGVFENNSNIPFAEKCRLFRFIGNLQLADMFMLTLGLCAIGLVLIPEVIYVKDIYTGDYKRANTMFKLTYQAYILFGIVMGYALIKLLFFAKKNGKKIFAAVMLFLLAGTFGYFGNSTTAWFGDYSIGTQLSEEIMEDSGALSGLAFIAGTMIAIGFASYFYLVLWKKKRYFGLFVSASGCLIVGIASMIMWFNIYDASDRYQGLNAGEYLKNVNYADYSATNWINENIEGRPVMLEANGDSYTDYCRVSVRTGLPTLLGWKTHEWLWQSDASGNLPAIVSEREKDVETMYSSSDIQEMKRIINKYDIEYIYVGDCEREKFESIDYNALVSLGEIIYPVDSEYVLPDQDTFIIKVNR